VLSQDSLGAMKWTHLFPNTNKGSGHAMILEWQTVSQHHSMHAHGAALLSTTKLYIQLSCFWKLSIVLLLFKIQCFRDWVLSPSSRGTYSVGPTQ
jgi:hypothetical protein